MQRIENRKRKTFYSSHDQTKRAGEPFNNVATLLWAKQGHPTTSFDGYLFGGE